MLDLAVDVAFYASPADSGRTLSHPITSLETLACYLRSTLLQTVVWGTLLLELGLPTQEYLLLNTPERMVPSPK